VDFLTSSLLSLTGLWEAPVGYARDV
jgi:hypothetical protein